jgi:hypothetical protein
MTARSSKGAERSSASCRAPAPVTQRSTASIRLPCAPGGGTQDFQTGPRCLVHRHMRLAVAGDRGQQQR